VCAEANAAGFRTLRNYRVNTEARERETRKTIEQLLLRDKKNSYKHKRDKDKKKKNSYKHKRDKDKKNSYCYKYKRDKKNSYKHKRDKMREKERFHPKPSYFVKCL